MNNENLFVALVFYSKEYKDGIKNYIKDCVAFQEDIGLDILVHGEPERNDMVEYFGEQMEGFVFSKNAWVQSYGSRCVKPPIIYGDISRPKAMTVEWITYAQSLTKKIMKGMLTGPVTILNWSFVRDDISRESVCKQIALGIMDEIDDLQKAGIKIIQVDEAAFKEGYPLRTENIKEYEKWALECFKIATAIAKPETQIHTHMCYSEFNDIIKTIEKLDADVISIETTRSGNELLKVFKKIGYTHEIGPGVYDIHSPRIPSVEEIKNQIKALLEVLPKEKSESSKRFDRFVKFLKHRLYFMFIPHSKKKTITLSLPVYAIIILVIIISGALLVTFSFLTKNTIIANKIEILSGSYNDKLEEIDSLEILFNSLVTNDYYRADMLNLVNNLKANDIKNHNADLTNYDFEEKTAIINARAEEFEKLKSYLEELKVNVNSKNSALESVPSILPIDSRYAVISIPYQKDSLISKGIGFETIAGTVIRSAATGTVNNIYYDNNKGFTIVIYHKFGIITTYRGLATSFVSEDKDLKKGEIIGNAKTGVFEYELKLASENVNPLIFTSLN